ncbi:MAG: S41 family peptidase [Candidatus Cryptobacteroides sp.]
MMNKYFTIMALALLPLMVEAQDLSKFKEVPEEWASSSDAYMNGNAYQRDAILFVNLLAETHPYYVKAERRAVLESRLPALLDDCRDCNSDTDFVKLLREVMPEVRDKHTDVIDYESFINRKPTPATEVEASGTGTSPLENNGKLFGYQILDKESICYLQFNNCNDARTLRDESQPRFDLMLDEMFSEMGQCNIETLIVDLQYNGGGSSRLCDELLDRLYPFSKLRNLDAYLRFSPLLALYNPKTETAMKAWEDAGHIDELYPMPRKNVQVPEHEYYQGRVVFIQGPKTYSSAGILITTARDNAIGTVVGTESTYSPSHYGEVLPFRLPNTGVLGSVCTKYFERADKSCAEDKSLEPDVFLNLDDKNAAWSTLIEMYSKL